MKRSITHGPEVAVFDLGKVLLDFDYGLALERLVPSKEDAPGLNQETLMESPVFNQFERGELDERAFYRELKDLAGFADSFDGFRSKYCDIFTEISVMIDAWERLRSVGVATWILSNTNALAVDWIRERYPFFNQFDGHVCSHEVGSMKPDAAIYEALEAATGATGPNILYVDDRLENVVAAAQRGWRVVHQTNPSASRSLMLAAFGL